MLLNCLTFQQMSRLFVTKVVVFGAEVGGREWKEPDRATGVPAPPARRHRNFLISLLLDYSYLRFNSSALRLS